MSFRGGSRGGGRGGAGGFRGGRGGGFQQRDMGPPAQVQGMAKIYSFGESSLLCFSFWSFNWGVEEDIAIIASIQQFSLFYPRAGIARRRRKSNLKRRAEMQNYKIPPKKEQRKNY